MSDLWLGIDPIEPQATQSGLRSRVAVPRDDVRMGRLDGRAVSNDAPSFEKKRVSADRLIGAA